MHCLNKNMYDIISIPHRVDRHPEDKLVTVRTLIPMRRSAGHGIRLPMRLPEYQEMKRREFPQPGRSSCTRHYDHLENKISARSYSYVYANDVM